MHDALTGHTSPAVSRKYGNELYPLEPLFEAIEHYDVAGLDLSHLLPSGYTPKVARGELKVICVFNGIVIAFAPTKANSQALIIAQCQGQEVAIDVMTHNLRYGQLPANKMVLVNAWIALRRDDIVANWHAGRVTGEYLQLAPLR
ncbi:MAG TPA: DUF4160 domain-containing protein [Azoarcus taiwanensis]|nr:DUF4160 domain-containing protein [Azoarcus taiwanensis]